MAKVVVLSCTACPQSRPQMPVENPVKRREFDTTFALTKRPTHRIVGDIKTRKKKGGFQSK